MQADNFSLPQYLQRIGYQGSIAPTAATLSALMQQQLFSVPFENLDVQAGKVVSLVPEEIVEKILHRQRGGYCYEVNALFAMALQALGIPYQMVAARPMFYPARRPRTHMALVAQVQGASYLCDLGFGSYGLRLPLDLAVLDTVVEQDGDRFKLSKTPQDEFLVEAWVDGQWARQYSFDLWPQEWVDFAPVNYLNSTHPDTIFVKQRLIILQNAAGRKMLSAHVFKTLAQGQTHSRTVDDAEIAQLLADEFGLACDA